MEQVDQWHGENGIGEVQIEIVGRGSEMWLWYLQHQLYVYSNLVTRENNDSVQKYLV